jgi:heme oxygenase
MTSLRHATREAHQSVDSDMRQGNWLNSPSLYATFLDRTLRFHRIVETAVTPVAWRIDGLDYADRRRSPLLEHDLAALARAGVVPIPRTQDCVQAAPLLINGAGAALGCLYVVEGATLGGAVLARWIESRLGYDRGFGASSFAAYPGVTMSRWRAFAAVVEDRLTSAPDERARMISVARATFALHQVVVVNPSLAAETLSS